MQRPRKTLLRKGEEPEINTEQIIYGDDALRNNIGQIAEIMAQDGKTSYEYDFKGNVIRQSKCFTETFDVQTDWDNTPHLQRETFITQTSYNALNQPIDLVHPDNTINEYSYDKGGLLQSISQNDIIYITNISYNPKGQRENIYYGNNTKTRYDYNPLNFRLERILTTRNGGQDILQDLNYIYDPEGSIIEIRDHAQQIHYFNNQVVDLVSRYKYDALYRLKEATGRGLSNLSIPTHKDFENDIPSPDTDANAMRNYTQKLPMMPSAICNM